jgi:tyrosinase
LVHLFIHADQNLQGQVDRLAAIYQAIFPGSNVEPLGQTEANFGHPELGVEDIDTTLTPFRHADGKDWTSREVSSAKSIYDYGYAYPEVPVEYKDRSDAELQEFASKAMEALYGPKVTKNKGDGFHDSPAKGGDGSTARNEWLAHINYDESQIDGTFGVWVYMGEVPESGDSMLTDDSLIGGCMSFAGGHQNHKSMITGTVPLTQALLKKKIALGKESVVAYLKDNLHWRILRVSTNRKIFTGNYDKSTN